MKAVALEVSDEELAWRRRAGIDRVSAVHP